MENELKRAALTVFVRLARSTSTRALVSCALGLTVFLAVLLRTGVQSTSSVALSVAAGILTFTVLTYLMRPPRTPTGRIGVVIAIHCEDPAMHSRLEHDLAGQMDRTLEIAGLANTLSVLLVPQHLISARTDQGDAEQLLRDARGNFLIYGNLVRRQIGGLDHYVLQLQSMVSHAVTTQQNQ